LKAEQVPGLMALSLPAAADRSAPEAPAAVEAETAATAGAV
jgi:hypothetical protein